MRRSCGRRSRCVCLTLLLVSTSLAQARAQDDGGARGTELYDVAADPGETRNMAAQAAHRATVTGLQQRLHRMIAAGTTGSRAPGTAVPLVPGAFR